MSTPPALLRRRLPLRAFDRLRLAMAQVYGRDLPAPLICHGAKAENPLISDAPVSYVWGPFARGATLRATAGATAPQHEEGLELDTFGQHLLVEYHGCDVKMLDSVSAIERAMKRAAEAAGANVVTSTFHRFAPQGVSGVVVIEESHLSIHTWPECGYAAVDFYTCGDCEPERAHELLAESLSAARSEVMQVHRGLYPSGRSMRIERHEAEGAELAATAPSAGAAAPLWTPET
jgi:S-adenosylmethionine decarboxylase